jgi:catalase-peroxidase
MSFFRLLLDYEYELVTSPAGARQWQPVNVAKRTWRRARTAPGKRCRR